MCRYLYTLLWVNLAADSIKCTFLIRKSEIYAIFYKCIHTYLIFSSKTHNEINI